MRSKSGEAAARRLRPVFIGAAALLILLLAAFAYAIANSQSQQRDDAQRRFNDRARVAATVNESLFSLATTQGRTVDAQRFGGAKVDETALQQRTEVQQQIYAQIIDSNGKVLASAGQPPANLASHPTYKLALKSSSVVYSSLMDGPGGIVTIESAVGFPTKSGVRVDVSGGKADVLSQFLNSFLAKLPTVANAKSYVIDSAGKVIATPGQKIQAGAELPDKDLADVVLQSRQGAYDGNRYFTSSRIQSTPWRIVLTANKDDLYSEISTTVPWITFAGFALVSLLGMILLWRVLISNAELARADLSRQHALEINDNVVQRLVLAKYALDRGATETSQQKLSETLRETQQLVTSLLEEREIEPGALRREVPAETEGRPDPASRAVERKQ